MQEGGIAMASGTSTGIPYADLQTGGRFALAAGVAAQVAGLVWLFQWAHALVTHGVTAVNLKRLWMGLTWLDSAQFLALSFVLLIPGVTYISRRVHTPSSALRVLRWVVVSTLVSAAVGTALHFGLYERGSYVQPDSPLVDIGGVVQALSSLVLTLALGAFAAVAARSRSLPAWLVPVLVLGALTTVFPGGPNIFFGLTLPPIPALACLAFGGWLLTQHNLDAAR